MRRLLVLLSFVASAAFAADPVQIHWTATGGLVADGAFPGNVFCTLNYSARAQFVFYGPVTNFHCMNTSGTDFGLFYANASCPDSSYYADYNYGMCMPVSSSPALEALLGMSTDDAETIAASILLLFAVVYTLRLIRKPLDDDLPEDS